MVGIVTVLVDYQGVTLLDGTASSGGSPRRNCKSGAHQRFFGFFAIVLATSKNVCPFTVFFGPPYQALERTLLWLVYRTFEI